MSRLQKTKAAQIEAAEKEGLPDPYQTRAEQVEKKAPPKVKPVERNPNSRLLKTKAAQIAAAKENGEPHPYVVSGVIPAGSSITVTRASGDLPDYQAAMEIDLAKIKAESTLEGKQRVKSVVLPNYADFIEDYITNGHNYPNDVAVQVMVWLLDVGDIENGLNLALFLIEQNQKMPARFDRDMPTFLCDFIYDWANEQLKAEHSASPYLDTLVAKMDADKWPVHELEYSKLYTMLAKHKERTEDYKTALELCEKAEAINPGKAGVKGLKDRLKKRIAETAD